MLETRKVVLYIAMSVDGFIAKQNDDIDFLSLVEKGGEDYGYSDFVDSIDAILIGRKTYDRILAMGHQYPHRDKEVYIISRTSQLKNGTFNYYTGSLKGLIAELRSKHGKNIYCDGGAEIVNELLKEDLIDEFVISIIPILLGEGLVLFKNGNAERSLKLISATHFEKGLVQVHYERVR